MRIETTANKLVALLGLDPTLAPAPVTQHSKKKYKHPLPKAVTLEEIEAARGAQATALFLQAPELFKSYICKREECQSHFIVSRTLVAFCSYECMKKELADSGIDWNHKVDEEYVRRVWEGNEPLRVPPAAVKVLMEIVQTDELGTTNNGVTSGDLTESV